MSDRLILLTGGARSGKSSHALSLATGHTPKMLLATATASDEEMRVRIERHRAERSGEWSTVEEPIDLASVLAGQRDGVVVVDCITLWISNLLERGDTEADILAQATALINAAAARRGPTILVTNEVGMGLVPVYPLGRAFRDIAGTVNQSLARAAETVILMVSGLPLRVK